MLSRTGGATTRTRLLQVLSRNQLDDEIARRHLVRLFARTYCRPWDVDQPRVRDLAAVLSVGTPCALSHVTGLRRYGLPAPELSALHLTVPAYRHPSSVEGQLVVHRTRNRIPFRTVGGLPTVLPAIAVAQSWPMIGGNDQRAAAIAAVRTGVVRPADLRSACDLLPGLPRRAELTALVGLLASGCESELEVWGHLHVFDTPAFRHGVRQRWIEVRGHRYRLDLAFEAERVAVELDGRGTHSSWEQRDRDMRRDAALASIGWITLRFTHRRLHSDVAGVRRDVAATLANRRRVAG